MSEEHNSAVPDSTEIETGTPVAQDTATAEHPHGHTVHEIVDEVSEVVVRQGKSAVRWVMEWLGIILVALSAAFLIRACVFQTFYIPSVSMVPTLEVGDRIIVSKLSVTFGDINRGDIVVCKHPPPEQ